MLNKKFAAVILAAGMVLTMDCPTYYAAEADVQQAAVTNNYPVSDADTQATDHAAVLSDSGAAADNTAVLSDSGTAMDYAADLSDSETAAADQAIYAADLQTTAAGVDTAAPDSEAAAAGDASNLSAEGTADAGDASDLSVSEASSDDSGDASDFSVSEASSDDSDAAGLFVSETANAADDADVLISGSCGTKATYSLTSDGTLTISGSGAMEDYGTYADYSTGETISSTQAPWTDYSYSITSIVIQEGITSIGMDNFMYCSSLTDLELPSTLKTIGTDSFLYAVSLESLVIPDNVTAIYTNAFYGCYNLKQVTLPASLKTLGSAVFGDCMALESYSISASNTTYCTVDGILYSKDKKILEMYPENKAGTSFTIPSTVTELGEDAFSQNLNLVSVTIPSSVKTIDSGAFYNMQALKSLTIPATVESFDAQILTYCTSLETLVIKSPVTSIPYAVCAYCDSLKKVTLPSTVQEIESYAFYNCTSLTSINFPSGLEKIGSYAFGETGITTYPSSLVGSVSGGYELGGTISITGTYHQSSARGMLSTLNSYRTGGKAWYYNADGSKYSTGKLTALKYDYNLEKIAMERAAEISIKFDHERLTGEYVFTESINGTSSWAENIACGQTTADEVYNDWLETNYSYSGQGHRRNMLNADYTSIGIASFTRNGTTYWVQEFGYTSGSTATTAVNSSKTVSLTYKNSLTTSSGASLASTSLTLYTGVAASAPSVTTTLSFTGSSYTTTQKTIPSWKSSNTSVVKVSGSTLTPVAAGTAVLSASVNGKTVKVTVTVKKALSAPQLSSAANCSGGIKVTWKAVSGAAKYRVCRKEAGGSWSKVGDTTAVSYSDTTAVAGKTYYYTVRCLTSDGKAYTSNYDTNGIGIVRLVTITPSLSNAVAGTKISWSKAAGADGYLVYRKSGSGSYQRIASVSSGTLSYTDTTCTSGTTYTYAVRAKAALNGTTCLGGYTGKSIISLKAITYSDLTLTQTSSGVKVSWKKVTGASGYRVYRKTGANGTYAQLADVSSSTLSYTDKTAKSGITYYYCVRAFNGSTFGSYSGRSITCK